MDYYVKLPANGAGGVTSINTLTGAVTLAAGTGISITPSGNTLTIANTGAGSGTVTSVALTAPPLFTVSGSPVTSAGTLALTYSGSALPVANGGTGTTSGSITGTSELDFTAGGTNQNVVLTPSGTGYTILNGNVGIGTTTPADLLDVSGGFFRLTNPTESFALINWTDATSFGGLQFTENGNGMPDNGTVGSLLAIGSGFSDPSRRLNFSIQAGNAVEIYTDTAITPKLAMTITNSASVGIGTSTPSTLLEVSGTVTCSAVVPANGATGTFTTADSKTVTVINGIITSIV